MKAREMAFDFPGQTELTMRHLLHSYLVLFSYNTELTTAVSE